MQVKDLMTSDIRAVPPETTLEEASKLMRDLDIGALPVSKNDGLMGIVTDRDITIRAGAQDWDFDDKTVADVMSPHVQSCFDTDTVEDAVKKMEDKQVRRLAVTDNNKKLIGMLSLGDVSQKASHELSGEALEAISRH